MWRHRMQEGEGDIGMTVVIRRLRLHRKDQRSAAMGRGRRSTLSAAACLQRCQRERAAERDRPDVLPELSAKSQEAPFVFRHHRGAVMKSVVTITWLESGALPALASLPELKLPEQLVLLLLGQQQPAAGLLALVDEARKDCLEILRQRCGSDLHIALDPLLGRREAPPTWKLGSNTDLAPFRMMAGFQQRLKTGEERLDEIHQIAIALRSHLKIGSGKHRAHRHRVDRLVRRHESRIIGSSEPCWQISCRHCGIQRNGKEVEASIAVEVAEDRCRLSRDEAKGGDLALAQLFERDLLIVIGRRDRNLQKVEQTGRGDRGLGPARIDIYLLVSEVGDAREVLPREEMELRIVELSDIGDPIPDT